MSIRNVVLSELREWIRLDGEPEGLKIFLGSSYALGRIESYYLMPGTMQIVRTVGMADVEHRWEVLGLTDDDKAHMLRALKIRPKRALKPETVHFSRSTEGPTEQMERKAGCKVVSRFRKPVKTTMIPSSVTCNACRQSRWFKQQAAALGDLLGSVDIAETFERWESEDPDGRG